MKKLLFLLILGPTGLFAQFNEYLKALPPVHSDPALRKVAKVGKKYKISEFYPSWQTAAIYYQNQIDFIETFEYANEGTEFYENAQVRCSKILTGKKTVILENFLDGSPFRESVVQGDQKEISTIYDLAGTALVKEGAGVGVELVRYGHAALLEKGEYREGKRTGDWESFHEKLFARENYRKGRLVEGVSFGEDGTEIPYLVKYKPAYLTGGYDRLGNGIVMEMAKVEKVALKDFSVIMDLHLTDTGELQSYALMSKAEEPVILLMELVAAADYFHWQPAQLGGQNIASTYRFKYRNHIK